MNYTVIIVSALTFLVVILAISLKKVDNTVEGLGGGGGHGGGGHGGGGHGGGGHGGAGHGGWGGRGWGGRGWGGRGWGGGYWGGTGWGWPYYNYVVDVPITTNSCCDGFDADGKCVWNANGNRKTGTVQQCIDYKNCLAGDSGKEKSCDKTIFG